MPLIHPAPPVQGKPQGRDVVGLPASIIRANLGVGNVVVLSEALNSSGRAVNVLEAVWQKLEVRNQLRVLFEWPEVDLRKIAELSSEKACERALLLHRQAWQWCLRADRSVTCMSAVSVHPTGAIFTNPSNDFAHCLSHWSFLYSKVGELKEAEPKAKIVVITSPWSACGKALYSLTKRKPPIPVVTVLLQNLGSSSTTSGIGSNAEFTLKY